MRAITTAATTMIAVVLCASPAAATSCAGLGDVTPAGLLEGEEAHGARLFERFDLAVVGTVTAIRTNEAPGAEYGLTRTTVDVHAAFNVAELPDTIDVSSPDPGWMSGYNFQYDTTYFIPLRHRGPQGHPNYSSGCNPIFPLTGPEAAEGLQVAAADSGVTVALLSAPEPPVSTPADGPGTARLAALGGLGVVALLAVAGVAVVARRRGHTA